MTVTRIRPPQGPRTHGASSHDDIAYVKRSQVDRGSNTQSSLGWRSTAGSATPRRRFGRRLGTFLLLLPIVIGVLGAPTSPQPVRGDEISDARAREAALKKEVAAQKAQVAQLNALQADLAAEIRGTTADLRGINADLTKVRARIETMAGKIDVIREQYDVLVGELAALDSQLLVVEAREVAKKEQLAARKATLAERVRSAYDTDRTSLMESFLSGGTFTDLLAEMSYFIDVGEQDKTLATQITIDQETLAALHQTTEETRDRTNVLRQETAAQKRALDKSYAALKQARAELKVLERKTAAALAAQKRAYAAVAANEAAARAALAKAAAAQRQLQSKIAALIRKQQQRGNIPSSYNGTLSWPMNGNVTQDFGCTGFGWEPPLGSCAHFHQGIDIVAPNGTPVKASGAGTVVYIGYNPYDPAPQAWIVIIAHSAGLQTWYAHMQPRRPVSVGQHVSRGTVIGYEGSTGRSTGPHLHWAVMLNGSFANPRLFL